MEFLLAGYVSIITAVYLYYIVSRLKKYSDTLEHRDAESIKLNNSLDTYSTRSLPVVNAANCNSRFKNLVLYSGYNTTFTEVDEVIVSPYGIFCIEYKAHAGYIFGSKADLNWTQCKYDGRHKLYNPLRQNYKHLKALEKLLGSDNKAPIHSLVVFTGAKGVKTDSDQVLIGYAQLHDRLSQYTTQYYDAYEYARICHKLLISSANSNLYLDTHIRELQEYKRSNAAIA